jgi:hypothetical protein
LICFTHFLVPTWFHMCYFLVLMSSLFFYNVENSKNKEKTLEWVGVSKLLTGTVQFTINTPGLAKVQSTSWRKTNKLTVDYRKRRAEHTPVHTTGLQWSGSRASISSVSTSLRNYCDPHTPTLSWRRHDNTSSPSGGWKDLAWALRSSKNSTQLHHWEHLDWLHHRLVWQLLGIQPQGTRKGHAYSLVHHWGLAPCYPPGPLCQAVSVEGHKGCQRLQPTKS